MVWQGLTFSGGPILIHPLLKNVPCHLWLRRTVETQCAAWSLQPCRLHWQCHGRLGPWGDSLLCCCGRRKWPRQGIWPAFGSLGLPPSTRSQWIVMGGPLSKIRSSDWNCGRGWQDGPQIITHPQWLTKRGSGMRHKPSNWRLFSCWVCDCKKKQCNQQLEAVSGVIAAPWWGGSNDWTFKGIKFRNYLPQSPWFIIFSFLRFFFGGWESNLILGGWVSNAWHDNPFRTSKGFGVVRCAGTATTEVSRERTASTRPERDGICRSPDVWH
jgi:hypothetical protein